MEEFSVSFILVLFVWTVDSLVFNGLILISVLKYRILKKKAYFLMISLSVCDIFKVLVYIPYAIGGFLQRGRSKMNFCLVSSSIGVTLLFCTTMHLMMESLNRLLLIHHPFKYVRILNKKIMGSILTVIWLLPPLFVLFFPYILPTNSNESALSLNARLFACKTPSRNQLNNESYGFKMINETTSYHLTTGNESQLSNISLVPVKNEEHSRNKIYNFVIHGAFFSVPVLTMLICYTFIFLVSISTARELRRLNVFDQPDMLDDANNDNISEENEEVKKQKQSVFSIQSLAISFNETKYELNRILKERQKEIRAAKTILIIFLTFVICNAPFFATVWSSLTREEDLFDTKTRVLLLNLAFAQVTVNPLVYFFRLDDFRRARRTVKRYGTSIIQKSIRRRNVTPKNTLNMSNAENILR